MVTATEERRTPNRSEPKQEGVANNFTDWKHTSQVHLGHRWAQSIFSVTKHRINLPGTSLQLGDQREVKLICITSPAVFQANLFDFLTAGHFYRVIVLQTVLFLFRTWESCVPGITSPAFYNKPAITTSRQPQMPRCLINQGEILMEHALLATEMLWFDIHWLKKHHWFSSLSKYLAFIWDNVRYAVIGSKM